MKKIYTSIAVVLLAAITLAQTPEKMSYQAVIRDANDHLLTEQSMGIQISILQGSMDGTPVYVETHSPTSNINGLVSVEIGTGTAISGSFTAIDWANDVYFLKTETDPSGAGGTNYTINGVSQLLSVPYALHARTADSLSVDPTESDPVYSISEAANITAGDISNLANLADPAPGIALEINSTQGALLLPRIATTQRDAISPLEGMIIYNTDSKKFQGYAASDGLPALDQQHTTIDNGGGEDRAQSFTAGISGNLSSIELPFNTMMGSTEVNISIREGDGISGAVLHSQTLTIISGGMIWYPLPISGVSIVAGNSYTIHVTEVVPGACGEPFCYDWGLDSTGDNYAGGLFYFQGTPYHEGIYDCAFKTYVSQPEAGWVDLH